MIEKQLKTGKLVQFFCSDFAKGIFTGMISNCLLYIFQPSEQSGLPSLIPILSIDNPFFKFITVMAIVTLITKIVDAVSDPIVANWSDKSKNPRGRRMPFMQWTAIPYGLSCMLIFFAPFKAQTVGNAIWVGVFLTLYFVFYTFYSIPQRALIPEIIPDAKKRVNAYSISTVFFMSGSALAYTISMLAGFIKQSGLDALTSWRIVIAVFGVIGIILLVVSAFSIKEKDYLKHTNPPREPFLQSLKLVVKNRDFMVFTFADLCNYIAMAFFQSTMFYYIIDLIGVSEQLSFAVFGTAIGTAVLFFPLIIHVCKKYNKKTPLLVASGLFAILFTIIFFGDVLALKVPPIALGIGMGLIVAYPFAAINIIPQTIVSDIIQEDTLRTGKNREGMFSAAKTFLEKMAYAVAWFIVSIVLNIGATPGNTVGIMGIKLTGPIAGVFALISFILIFFYREKRVMNSIKTLREKQEIEENDASAQNLCSDECNQNFENAIDAELAVNASENAAD